MSEAVLKAVGKRGGGEEKQKSQHGTYTTEFTGTEKNINGGRF